MMPRIHIKKLGVVCVFSNSNVREADIDRSPRLAGQPAQTI